MGQHLFFEGFVGTRQVHGPLADILRRRLPGQELDPDFGLGRHGRQAPYDVFELANVARPLPPHEIFTGCGAQGFGRHPQLVRRLGQKMFDQQGQVLAALPQGRQGQGGHIEAVVEILPKGTVP